MGRRAEGLLVGAGLLLLWVTIFLAGLSLVFPSPGQAWWALIPSNPLLLYLWLCLYGLVTLGVALGLVWVMGKWLPPVRRGLLVWWEGWRQLRNGPRLS